MKTLGIKGCLFVLFLVVCICCSILGGYVAKDLGHSFSMEYKYGKLFNTEREKRRIPLLPKEWWGRGIVMDNSITWTDPEFYWNGIAWGDGSTPLRPKYYQKYVLVQGDTILETDEYLGQIIGTKYSNGGEPIPIFETIKIIHTYNIN